MVGKTAQDYLPAVGDPGMVGKTVPRITSLRSVILVWSAKQPKITSLRSLILEWSAKQPRITSLRSVILEWSAKQPKRREPRGRCLAWSFCFAAACEQAQATSKQKTPDCLWQSGVLFSCSATQD